MEAFGIFDGGGVKCAALAGCLEASEGAGVNFEGFGGTSGGAIVALLATAGYSGAELSELLVSTELTVILDDGGKELSTVRNELDSIAKGLDGSIGDKIVSVFKIRALVRRFWHTLGVYDGAALERFLYDKLTAKLPALESKEPRTVSFQDLTDLECKPLKVVVTDTANGRALVYPDDRPDNEDSVLEAVRASAAYPFAFKPIQKTAQTEELQVLVDGGLSSNLPSFLFSNEYTKTRIPTLASDLVDQAPKKPRPANLVMHSAAMLTTALEASDRILTSVAAGVEHIPVVLDQEIDPLDFSISRERRQALRNAGYRYARDFLSSYPPLKIAGAAGHDIKRELASRYGSVSLYAPVLDAIARDLEEVTESEDVRTSIMLPTGRNTLMVVYDYHRKDDADTSLEIAEDAGCAGKAFKSCAACVADLAESRENPEAWGMNRDQHNAVPSDRRTMISVPIQVFDQTAQNEASDGRAIGVLSADTSTLIRETRWVKVSNNDDNDWEIEMDVSQVMKVWSEIISTMMP